MTNEGLTVEISLCYLPDSFAPLRRSQSTFSTQLAPWRKLKTGARDFVINSVQQCQLIK